jgi:hypothetical protein
MEIGLRDPAREREVGRQGGEVHLTLRLDLARSSALSPLKWCRFVIE